MATTDRALELVVFKLKEGVSREQFLGTDGAVSAWISEQPGFISHELSYDAEGDRWIEVAWWRTMDDAKAAALKAETSESCAPMFTLIERETELMLHAVLANVPVHADTTAVGA
jgi:hypothetical protein